VVLAFFSCFFSDYQILDQASQSKKVLTKIWHKVFSHFFLALMGIVRGGQALLLFFLWAANMLQHVATPGRPNSLPRAGYLKAMYLPKTPMKYSTGSDSHD
jgi:hypothetical protein